MSDGPQSPPASEPDAPLLTLVTVLLRRRRSILLLALTGSVLGLLLGLLSRRVYISQALFLPQANENALSGLALAASQIGLRLPQAQSGGWGPPVYVELLQSRSLLQDVVADTVTVAEEGGRRVTLMDLLKVTSADSQVRVNRAVVALRNLIQVRESKPLGGVQLTVATHWPSVSQAIAARLIDGVSRFNLETRQSQALAERRFVEARVGEAEKSLREAEDRLQVFLSRNRSLSSSPELGFERDRLQREVTLRQQLYTTLLQNLEEARIREVRDTPVLTMLESPQVPVLPAGRRSLLKAAVGLLGGSLLGVGLALLAHGLGQARSMASGAAREFFDLTDQMVPSFLRRKKV